MKKNISLIGMAGVGKTFTSKILAEKLNYEYISADDLIAEEALKIGANEDLLSDDDFMKLEEEVIVSLKNKVNVVIDTGGSVIYSPKAMEILNEISFIVYLSDSAENIKKRFDDRGESHLVGMVKGMTFERLLEQRENLYEKYSHIKIDVLKHKEDIVPKILNELNPL